MYKNFIKILVIFSFTMVLLTGTSFAEPVNTVEQIKDAEEYFLNGEYRKAIEIYDDILEAFPADTKIREMKAVSLSNMRLYTTLAAQPGSTTSMQYDVHNLNEKSHIYKNPPPLLNGRFRRRGYLLGTRVMTTVSVM